MSDVLEWMSDVDSEALYANLQRHCATLHARIEALEAVAAAAREFDEALDTCGADAGAPRLRMSKALAALAAGETK